MNDNIKFEITFNRVSLVQCPFSGQSYLSHSLLSPTRIRLRTILSFTNQTETTPRTNQREKNNMADFYFFFLTQEHRSNMLEQLIYIGLCTNHSAAIYG